MKTAVTAGASPPPLALPWPPVVPLVPHPAALGLANNILTSKGSQGLPLLWGKTSVFF